MKYNLWDRKWEVFMIKDIFEIKKVKWRPIENYNNWLCPYISTSSNNNWLIWFVKWEKSEISEWNCISVDPIKWISFYHKYDIIKTNEIIRQIKFFTIGNIMDFGHSADIKFLVKYGIPF